MAKWMKPAANKGFREKVDSKYHAQLDQFISEGLKWRVEHKDESADEFDKYLVKVTEQYK